MFPLNLSERINPAQATIWMVGVMTLVRLVAAGRVGLSGDEAHYALYGYFLDWSYFDHPPLIGWLQALALQLGDSFLVLRLWPIVLAALGSYLLFRLTRLLFPHDSPWIAFVTVLVWQSALIAQILSLAMLPDTPLLVAALLAALFLYQALVENRPKAWLGVGVAFGLAGLSKYTAVMLVLSAFWLMLEFRQWRQLATPWLWGGVALAVIMILPVIGWNYHHDWISLGYQLDHGMPERAWSLQRFALSLVGQLLAYGPLVVIGGGIMMVLGWRDARQRFLLALALPSLLPFIWNSGYEATLPHWTALGWLFLTPLIGRWIVEVWQQKRGLRIFSWGSAVYSAVLVSVLYSEFVWPWLPFETERYPFADLIGWQQVTREAMALADAMETEQSEPGYLFAGNWSYASHIAWHARPRAVLVTDQRFSQSDIWYGAPQAGANGVLVVSSIFRKDKSGNGTERFRRCELAKSLSIQIRGTIATAYDLYRCYGYRP